MSVTVTRRSELPWSEFAYEFIGADHGDVSITFLLIDAEPGQGPRLHRHPYDEVIIVLEGSATLDDGGETREVEAGDVIAIPAGQPHAFTNTGSGPLRQIDIHATSRFTTEWLA